MSSRSLAALNRKVVSCRACPRLVAHREQVAREKRRAYRDRDYWARPVPGFGDPQARLLLVGLAPGAHGSNRTGRMFTGDASGGFLFPALHRAGFASQAQADERDDRLLLRDCYITAVVRCAPPGNRPDRDELERCRPFWHNELELLPRIQVLQALGKIAFDGCLVALAARGHSIPRPRPTFGHGVSYNLHDLTLVGGYHPSRQNTNTGRLTTSMFDAVLNDIRKRLR